MPKEPDYTVEIVGPDGEPDMSVAVVGDVVVSLEGASENDVLTVQGDGSVAPEAPNHDTLAGVSADDHHAKSHAHDGADGSGTVSHANLTGVTANQHHNQSHTDADHSDGANVKAAAHTKAAHDSLALSHDSLSDVSADDHHAQVHGAADHTDVTRSLWIPARPGMVPDAGAQGALGAVPNSIGTITLADAASQGAVFDFQMPLDAKPNSPVSLQIWWAPAATVAGNSRVAWEIDAAALTNGSLTNVASTAVNFDGVNQNHVANTLVREAIQQMLASVSAEDLIRVEVRRIGGGANDNLTATAHLIGVHIEYTAVQ